MDKVKPLLMLLVFTIVVGCVYKAVQTANRMQEQLAMSRCIETSIAAGADPMQCPGAATALGR